MSKWLVTGGSGFLGTNLIRALVEKGQVAGRDCKGLSGNSKSHSE